MKFKDLLQGKTQQAQHALDDFFANIKEERILWYPSAGCDYRDVMEMRPERLALHQIPEAANIICHTDYMYRWTKLDQQTRWITVHKHARTLIRVIAKYPLAFTSNDIRHQIRREHTVKFNPWIQLRSAIENTRIERRLAAIVLSFFQSDQRREAHEKLQTAKPRTK
ncbi:MAG: hypothetical protein K9L60_05165, partial [Methylovulum sp.]|nr:hypothetical protein [Methylovulum sp.]